MRASPAELLRAGRRFALALFGAAAALLAVAGAGPASAQPAGAAGSGAAGSVAAASGVSRYPKLGSLGPDDQLYVQHQEQLAASYTALRSGGPEPDLVMYVYEPRRVVDLFSLAARLNLPYETLATLNRLDRAREFLPGETILVPSAPGLFAPAKASTDLDYLISYRDEAQGAAITLEGRGGPNRFVFFRGARFNPEERALFLGLLFRFPLPAARLTSGFGLRRSPVSGRTAMHDGIDLAAPSGTEVYAAREGRVSASGVDPVLGEFVVIDHEGGWQTVYGHLSLRNVRLNDRVESSMMIGRVGSTGLSTGPHLHFEVRSRGEARDPEPLIPKGTR